MFPRIEKDSIGVPRVLQSEIEPRPWMPDSFIDWIEPLLTKDMHVFEFGSGNSTLWLSPRVDCIVTADHHILWKQAVALACTSIWPGNQIIHFVPLLDNNYAETINSYPDPFDLIIIDGVQREECLQAAITAIKEDGIIVLDNSETMDYSIMEKKGFGARHWTGPYAWAKNGEIHQTTVFFKEGNRFGL